MTKKQQLRQDIRQNLPYGFIVDELHGCVFFNREYQPIEFSGLCKHPLPPQEMLDSMPYKAEHKWFALHEYQVILFGTMYYFYDDAVTPYYGTSRDKDNYLMLLATVAQHMAKRLKHDDYDISEQMRKDFNKRMKRSNNQ